MYFSSKMAGKKGKSRFTFDIPEGQENPAGVPIPTSPSSSPFKTFLESSSRRDKSYQEHCASYLRLPFGKSQKQMLLSPMNNWSLWTVWNQALTLNQTETDFYSEDEFIETVQKTLEKEPIFERNEWDDLVSGDSIMVRVTQEMRDTFVRPYVEGCTLRAQRIYFEEVEYPPEISIKDEGYKPPARVKVTRKKSTAIKLYAMGGLAEIFATVVDRDDVLVICGGHTIKLGQRKVPTVILNCDDDDHIQILRLPGHKFDEEMNLVELIEPTTGKHRYRFTYAARTKEGKLRRDLTQYRIFRYEDFGRNVLDFLAYEEKRWDFPVPVVAETAFSIYSSFITSDFSMFRNRKAEVGQRKVKAKINLNKTYNIGFVPRRRRKTALKRVLECMSLLVKLVLWVIIIVLMLFVLRNMKYMLPSWVRMWGASPKCPI